MTTLTVTLSAAELEALARLVQRMCWLDCRRFAENYEQIEAMFSAAAQLRRALTDAMFPPPLWGSGPPTTTEDARCTELL